DQQVPRLELLDFLVDGERYRNVAEREIAIARVVVEMQVQQARAGQRLDLGAEEHRAVLQGVKQRLDSQPIAAEDQRLVPRVPQREGEHPAQAADELGALLFIE